MSYVDLLYCLAGEYEVETETLAGEEGTVVEARHPSIRGCAVQAADEEGARRQLAVLRRSYLKWMAERGIELPEPDRPAERFTATDSASEESPQGRTYVEFVPAEDAGTDGWTEEGEEDPSKDSVAWDIPARNDGHVRQYAY